MAWLGLGSELHEAFPDALELRNDAGSFLAIWPPCPQQHSSQSQKKVCMHVPVGVGIVDKQLRMRADFGK